ncbi:beta-lactamase-like protein [Dactylonectria estremocensis]|uniref:Beta-lactamase-like protein n=1 Tax=Dactylonectria estremocensis TaxID=1079267 RepID=A0A9P9EH81_9HYPO|nr:beta-lactamase-like protein [Dactylonectria estremocensis]
MTLSTVQVHALSGGHLTLPESQFVHPASDTARQTVPSLCFLVQHESPTTSKTTRIVFDLGVRRDPSRYSEPIRRHIATRQPLKTDPDVVKSLKSGALTPEDIDYIIYSHVHWDHVGEPNDFLRSTFVVGHGSLDLLRGNASNLRGGHSYFEPDLLDPHRTIELPGPNTPGTTQREAQASENHSTLAEPAGINLCGPWREFESFASALDVFGDGSLYIIDAPGHLPGHINLLARTCGDGNVIKWVYLAGDACHDRRIMRHEREIGQWQDAEGHLCCIHADLEKAMSTMERIRKLESKGIETIFAHDVEWENDKRNSHRFWGA